MADLDFFNLDSEEIVHGFITGVAARLEEPLYPGDERRILLEAMAPVVVQMLQKINDSCKQRFLAYARNEKLDALGERLNVERIAPTPATTTLKFSLAEARTQQTFIPAGTRATADQKVFFATDYAAIIPAGSLSVEVPATCTEGGSAYNGILAGAIATAVDVVPYIAGVTNTTATDLGDDGEPQDDGGAGDDRYRERIKLAPAKLSTAGPAASYEYWALSSNANITDVKILNSQTAGTVDIVAICGDDLPTEDVLQDILSVCNDKTIRPMNDLVTARAPDVQSYDVTIKYYVTKETEAAAVAAIEGAGGAVDSFNQWQQAKIGRDINPDKLRALILAPTSGTGALRVEVTAPAFTALAEDEIARFSGTLNITHEVITE